ncbi:hypothetical protein BG36_13095 [Aquamicrobium defluvii]|uniref:Uncharacterized protein n=1 Tax=Aquamicrobium defluvii TaxID=69279 RepID=A0A011UAY8_9HYPH|nr:hypothetical protein BG36_13095 [Aquamicrobium defluvii]EZQ13457.1 hypothetical protein CF98_28225 [Halopseudomonas bauzanensis]
MIGDLQAGDTTPREHLPQTAQLQRASVVSDVRHKDRDHIFAIGDHIGPLEMAKALAGSSLWLSLRRIMFLQVVDNGLPQLLTSIRHALFLDHPLPQIIPPWIRKALLLDQSDVLPWPQRCQVFHTGSQMVEIVTRQTSRF